MNSSRHEGVRTRWNQKYPQICQSILLIILAKCRSSCRADNLGEGLLGSVRMAGVAPCAPAQFCSGCYRMYMRSVSWRCLRASSRSMIGPVLTEHHWNPPVKHEVRGRSGVSELSHSRFNLMRMVGGCNGLVGTMGSCNGLVGISTVRPFPLQSGPAGPARQLPRQQSYDASIPMSHRD